MLSIEDFIGKLELEFKDLPKGVIKADTRLSNYLTMDSINAVILAAHLEEHYDVLIDPEELADISTVRDIYQYLTDK
jgi:acyl carrier protein